MSEKKNSRPSEDAATVPVVVRLTRAEIDEIRAETGATADATAVACFVRKNIKQKRG